MGTCVHRKGEGEAARYRLWTTVQDRYLTVPLTRERMREYLILHAASLAVEEVKRSAVSDADERLMWADKLGSDERLGKHDTSKWCRPRGKGWSYDPDAANETPTVEVDAVVNDGKLDITIGTLPPMSADEAMDLAARIMIAAVRASE